MRWDQSIDPVSERAFVKNDLAKQTNTQPSADPALSASISRIQSEYGWLSPETKLVLAKSNASQEAIDKAAELAGRRLVDRNDPVEEMSGLKSFWFNKVYPKIKAASRWTQAGLDFIPESAQGAVAQIFDDNDDVNGWFISTKLGTMFEDSDKAGEGWFVGEEAAQKQAERARRYRGTVNGSAWTLGRQAANMLFLPNSKPYNLMSGVIDAAVLIRLDPTAPLTRTIGTIRQGGLMVGGRVLVQGAEVPLQSADEAAEAARLLRTESGLRDTEALDSNRWLRFMTSNRRARALVDRIWFNSTRNAATINEADELTRATLLNDAIATQDEARNNLMLVEERFKGLDATREEYDAASKAFNDATNEVMAAQGVIKKSEEQIRSDKLERLIDIFTDRQSGKLRVDTDTINDLLNAGSRDEVLAILSPQWVVKSGSLPQDIRNMQGITGRFADRIPLTAIRKSRWFTQTPGSKIVVAGSDLDNREALMTFRNWVRTIGADQETQQRLVGKALQAFSRTGSQTDQYETVNLFFDALGSSLKANGVNEAFANALKQDSQFFADALRLYMTDQAGKPFDGDFFDWLRQSGLEDDPDKLKSLMDKRLNPDSAPQIATPLTMVEMLNRAVYLPDVREIRRLTRSRLMTEQINKMFGEKEKVSSWFLTRKSNISVQIPANQDKIDEALAAVNDLDEALKRLDAEKIGFEVGGTEFNALTKRINDINNERAGLLEKVEDLKQAGFVDAQTAVRRGELRGAFSALEWYQQSLWKPLALMTGGYVVRNTLDAQIRMALGGFASVINHPFKYIALVTGRSAVGDVIGNRLTPRLVLPDGQIPKEGLAGIIQKIKYGRYEHADLAPELAGELSFGLREQGLDEKMAERMQSTRQFVGVSLQQDKEAWFRAFGQNGNQLNSDPLMRLVARTYSEAAQSGISDPAVLRETVIKKLIEFIKDPQNETIYRMLRQNLENGITIKDQYGNAFRWRSRNWDTFTPDDIDSVLGEYSKRMILNRVQMMSGGQDDVMFMFGYNAIPLSRKGVTAQPTEVPLGRLEGQNVGDAVQLNESTWGVITKMDTKTASATVQPVVSTKNGVIPAFPNRNISAPARNRLQQSIDEGQVAFNQGETGLPGELKYEELLSGTQDTGKLADTVRQFDKITDWFFGRLYASVTTKLDRNPVFRQAYYRALGTQVDRLSPLEAKKLVQQIEESAKTFDFTPQRYIGDRALWKRIVDKSKGAEPETIGNVRNLDVSGIKSVNRVVYDPDNQRLLVTYRSGKTFSYVPVSETEVRAFAAGEGADFIRNIKEPQTADIPFGVEGTGLRRTEEFVPNDQVASMLRQPSISVQDLDDFAKWTALNEMKGLLYNATARNNLEDALRVVAPFASAWREILGTYTNFMLTNPVNTYRQFQRVWTGLEGADPENDGRGFIYKDPTSGQQMFKFPMSGVLARALSGAPGYLEAPVGQLSAGISVIPALGPYGQLAVSQLPDNPSYDEIIEILLPYGRSDKPGGLGGLMYDLTPGWINKAAQALEGDTRDHATMFYNMYIDTVRAKAASGEYDLSDLEDKQRLLDDAQKAAKVLMAMRAASQFFGPTAASVEFQVPTSQGDQYVSMLSQEFYKMQAEDYDSAIPRFLEEFGDDVFVYVASKTRSVREGLEATEEFGNWERRNQGLLTDYPDVAAYFAPAGSDFSFAVWQRQLLSGEREKLSDREVLSLAQERVGAAKYRAMRLKAGPYPSDEIRDYLRQYRQALAKQYPGFPEVARFEVGKFPAQMTQLQQMVADNRLGDNDIRGAVAEYFAVREELLTRARAAGYVANDLRQTKALEPYRNYLASIGNELIRKVPEFGRIYDRLLAQEVEF